MGGQNESVSFIFGLKERIGALANALTIFKDNGVNLTQIKSRVGKEDRTGYEFIVTCEANNSENIEHVIGQLRTNSEYLHVYNDDRVQSEAWFPRRIRDLDKFANRILSYGSELDSDHPGFIDPVYRARRKELADLAISYRKYVSFLVTLIFRYSCTLLSGQPIPSISYTDQEVKTWGVIFTELTKLYPTHACKEYNSVFPLLVENCGYRVDNIPQLEDVSNFLKDCTGFTLRPVAGLLSSRDFLAGLAFRVFHSTQYIRHSSNPMYTPEPDVCHELLGHVPLFADPDFADFSQEIGLASLGAPDEYIVKLATCYWFTIEFGLCKQGNERRAFGAGLLSSFGELQYCLTDESEFRPFEPEKTCLQEYPITKYQPIYYLAESFKDVKEKMSAFAQKVPKPFSLRYNAFTQSVQVIENNAQIVNIVKDLRNEIARIEDAINKLRSVEAR